MHERVIFEHFSESTCAAEPAYKNKCNRHKWVDDRAIRDILPVNHVSSWCQIYIFTLNMFIYDGREHAINITQESYVKNLYGAQFYL